MAALVACGDTEPSDEPAETTTERTATTTGSTATTASATTTRSPQTTVAAAPAEPAKGTVRVCEVTAEGSAGKPKASYTDATFVVGERYRSTSKCSDNKDRYVP